MEYHKWKLRQFLGLGICMLFGLGAIISVQAAQTNINTSEPNSIVPPHSANSDRIIDHTAVFNWAIPNTSIDLLKEKMKIHIAGSSYYKQIPLGGEALEADNATFGFDSREGIMPAWLDKLCVMEGQLTLQDDVLINITADQYWATTEGIGLTNNIIYQKTPNVSIWFWENELSTYSESQVNTYLTQMAAFESAHPDTVFVYTTGHAQDIGEDGYNRYVRNEQIREYCITNNKWLFDFGDLDSYYQGTQQIYQYLDEGIPVENSQYHDSSYAHTSRDNCVQKAQAFWYLQARIAGWNPSNNDGNSTSTGSEDGIDTDTGETTNDDGSSSGFSSSILNPYSIGFVVVIVVIIAVVMKMKER